MSEKIQLNLPTELSNKIISALNDRNVNKPCPRCGCEKFYLLDGFIVHIVQSSISNPKLYGNAVVCVATTCIDCGYFAEHSLRSLGLLDEAKEYVDKQR